MLTPEKPEYGGGTWHVEGQLVSRLLAPCNLSALLTIPLCRQNEHIVATALYYYSNENITSSQLSFRQRSNTEGADDVGYEQDHHDWLADVFGCENYGSSVQEIGSVETRQGRFLAFPNVLQHKVQPFSLADPTKPGHRKILALFLVDPNIKIISTANVPCQRKDWCVEEVGQQKQVLSEDFPISLLHAKKLREELMDERSAFMVTQDNMFHSDSFSLCEH